MPVDTTFASDPAVATRHVQAFLHADPVRHNVLCTLLEERAVTGTPVRCWWAHQDGEVLGVAFQSPPTFPVLVSRLDELALEPLARTVSDVEGEPVPGINGAVEDVSRFAGALATIGRRPAHPVEGQRIYEIEHLVPPTPTRGHARAAATTAGDLELAIRWSAAFAAETDSVSEPQPEERLRRLIDAGRLWFWEDAGAARSTAVVSASSGGVTRVGFVYTPPEHRRRGHATAIVAHLSRLVLDRGDRCILYTQLSNPTSNAVYQRLGYGPVHECMRYELGVSSPS